MTDLPICGATWNGVGLTYICDQAPGHTGRHYAGHDGERIGWQPDTPATCGSRTRGGFGTTYQCDQPTGHDGAHRAHRDGEYVAGWTDDAAREQGAERERLHHLTQDRLSEQIRATQKARQQHSEANERATKAERRAAQSEAERRAADNVIRATLAALGAGPNVDPVILAREVATRAERKSEQAAAQLIRAEKAEARAAMLQTSRDYWKERAAELDADRDRYAAKLTAAKAENDGLAECLRNTSRITANEAAELRTRAERAEAFRDAVYEELCITDSTPPDAAIGAIRGRAINIGEQVMRATEAEARATRLEAAIRAALDPTTATG